MSICFLSGLVELLGISQVPILISALMPPPPPHPSTPPIPPPPTSLSDTHLQEGIHLHAGAHLNDGWRMSNTALVFFSPFHMMLTDTTKISLFETLSYLPFSSSSPSTSTHPSPRSFLYIYAGTFFFFFLKLWRLTLEKMRQWCLCEHQGVASERGTFFSYLRNKLCSKLDLSAWEGMDEWMMF